MLRSAASVVDGQYLQQNLQLSICIYNLNLHAKWCLKEASLDQVSIYILQFTSCTHWVNKHF